MTADSTTMHVNAHLDVDLVAVEQADQLTVMLDLLAQPSKPSWHAGPPTSRRA